KVSDEAAAAPTKATPAADAEISKRGASGGPVSSLGRHAAEERLSPVVRKLLAEHTLDPRAIAGTGRDGRITREDVLNHIARGATAAAPAAASAAAGDSGDVPLNNIRRRTAEHMAKSWSTVPHVLQVVEADFSRVDRARRAAGAQWKSYSLTYLPFIAHSVVAALAKHPRLNASFHGDHLAVHRRVSLGVAVALIPDGLMCSVLNDAPGESL